MAERYLIPAGQARVSITERNSRFIATGACTSSVKEAHAWIADIHKEFPDARHHCPAYRIGADGRTREWASDDGEPRGTAGRPILSLLQGKQLGDVTVVVTRYFGGIKLGTGGLMRAYSASVRELLEALPTKMKIPRVHRELVIDYALFQQAKDFLLAQEALIEEEEFGAEIRWCFTLPEDRIQSFERELTEWSNGRLKSTKKS